MRRWHKRSNLSAHRTRSVGLHIAATKSHPSQTRYKSFQQHVSVSHLLVCVTIYVLKYRHPGHLIPFAILILYQSTLGFHTSSSALPGLLDEQTLTVMDAQAEETL